MPATASTAPAKPIIESERWVVTAPPASAPVPMPRLKIPEYMDIATADSSSEEAAMTSDCIAILYAVTEIPQTAQTAMVRMWLCANGSRSTSAAMSPVIASVTKRERCFE